MTETMEDDNDSPVALPALKLSRVSRKPRKRIAAQAAPQNPKTTTTTRRKRQRKQTDVPIPSFSPVHYLDEVDISVLNSPKKKEEEKVVLFPDEEDDDDDDDLLDAPPTFAPTQTSKQSQTKDDKKPQKKKAKKDDNGKRAPVRQVSSDDDKAMAETTKLDADKLPEEAVQTIDTLLKELDITKLSLRDIVDMVVAEHNYDANEEMRKLIRAHIRSQMAGDGVQVDDSPTADSVAEQNVETEKADTTVDVQQVASRQVVEKKTIPAKRKRPAKAKPAEEDLIVSIDGLFVQADKETATYGQFIIALEGEYGAKLHKTSTSLVKTRLKGLMEDTIKPTVSFPSPPASSNDTAALLTKEALNVAKQQRDEATKDDDDDVVFAMEDEDTTPSINEQEPTLQVARKDAEVQSKKPNEELPVVEPPEKPQVKPKAKRRGRPPKKPICDEVVEIDESTSNARSQKQQKPVVKPAPKPKKVAAPKKPRAPRAKKGTCALCTTCTCTIGKETNVTDASAVMSRTDAEIERALIRRTQKLERIVDKYEALLDQVGRELKKHRRNVWKKQEAQLNDGRRLAFGDSRFLPDADVWDEQAQAVHLEALPSPVVEEAQETVFGNGNCQITLTQMFGGGSKEEDENANQNILDSIDDEKEEDCGKSQTVTDEDKEVDVDGEEDSVVDDEPEPEPVDRIHRLSWRNGIKVEDQSPLVRGSGAWSALTTTNKSSSTALVESNPYSPLSSTSPTRGHGGSLFPTSERYNCAWDTLFMDDVVDDTDDDARIDQLLDLFENDSISEPSAARAPTQEGFTQESQLDARILTQRGESVAESIESEITSDPLRLQSIEAVCPQWRDNIRYALAQRGETDIRKALERVQRSMETLQRTKEKVSTVWKRQEIVLQLFETAMLASLSRLESDESPDDDDPTTTNDGKKSAGSSKQEQTTSMLSPILEGDESLTKPSQ